MLPQHPTPNYCTEKKILMTTDLPFVSECFELSSRQKLKHLPIILKKIQMHRAVAPKINSPRPSETTSLLVEHPASCSKIGTKNYTKIHIHHPSIKVEIMPSPHHSAAARDVHLFTTATRCEFSRAAATRSLSLSCLLTVQRVTVVAQGEKNKGRIDGARN